MWYEIFFALGVFSIFGSVSFVSIFIYLFVKNRKEKQYLTNLKVSVIVPCKGIGNNLKENLEAICNQNYPDFKVIFVLDSEKDPAYPTIDKIVKHAKNASIEISEKFEEASGKISALIAGTRKAGDVDVYVFADSDIKPHKEWLALLVTYLSEKKVGATTGFRWFFPRDLKTSLISVWNMGSMASLFHPLSNYAWGGSTAIKKALFEKLQIESRWMKGFSDDLILTEAVKKAGYIIKFIPACVVESPPEDSINRFLKWGTQQFTWVRWYNPFIWSFAIFGVLYLHISIVLGAILIIAGVTIPGILLFVPIIFELIYGFVGILTLRKLMHYPKEKFGSLAPYAYCMPVAWVFYLYSIILAGFKKEIKWGGRVYTKKDALKKG